jgi:iron complex transport system ATP-binding protein
MIAARDLTLRAGARTLLRDASFAIERGEFIGLLGANGAGKTTLLRTLAGVRPPSSGGVLLEDRDLTQLPPGERARTIAHIAGDDLFLDQLLVRDVVSMGRYPHHRWYQWHQEPHDESAIEGAMRAVHLEPLANRRFDTLSSGERQRVWLALALAQEAPVLLLDEPTSHLDIRAAREILTLLRAQATANKTIVCALHDLNEAAEFCDRIILIGDGELLALAKPQDVLRPDLLQRAYGIRMETFTTPSGLLVVHPYQGCCASGMPGA